MHMNQLATMIHDVRADFIRMFYDANTKTHFQNIYIELETFKDYINTSYANLNDIFGLQVINISNEGIKGDRFKIVRYVRGTCGG
jgi:hypothetical protein